MSPFKSPVVRYVCCLLNRSVSQSTALRRCDAGRSPMLVSARAPSGSDEAMPGMWATSEEADAGALSDAAEIGVRTRAACCAYAQKQLLSPFPVQKAVNLARDSLVCHAVCEENGIGWIG
eukprot:5141799-Pleurochrysis_carterae.AAC.1